MARKYELKRRAERQQETKRRIVEAAVELHGTLGPGRTSVSQIAERAGIQRHTFYAHFPEERDLYMTCSGMALERDPLPDASTWRPIADPAERLRSGLKAVYGWYERNAELTACVLRDSEYHAPTREIMVLRFGPSIGAWNDVLGEELNDGQRALLGLALSFYSWRSLVCEQGFESQAAAAAMTRAIVGLRDSTFPSTAALRAG